MDATKLRKIIPGSKEFYGISGKKYFIETGINRKRYRMFKEAQIKLGYGFDFKGLFDIFEAIYEAVPNNRTNDIAVHARDGMQAVADVMDGREEPIIEICALFINTEDEDRTIMNDEIIRAKAEDWNDIEMESFFLLALSFIPNFADVYKRLSQATFNLTAQEEKIS
jgi:hypothetical protein